MIANATAEVGITEILATGCMGNGNAKRILTDGILEATYIVLTLTCAVSGNKDALIISTYIVVWLCVAAPEDRVTFILLITGEDDASGVIGGAFGVLRAINRSRALARTGSVEDYTSICTITFGVLCATAEDGIAFIFSFTGEDDASGEIFRTFGVFSAINDGGACIGTGRVDGDALVLIVTFHMALTTAKNGITFVLAFTGEDDASSVIFGAFGVFTAVDEGSAFIGTGRVDGDALIAGVTLGVPWAAPEDGITFILLIAGKDDASSVIFSAFGVFLAPDQNRTFIGTTTIDWDTLILGVTSKMLWAAAKNRITFVLSITRKDDASGVVFGAFGVFTTRNHRGAFVSARALCSDTLIFGITNEMLFDVATVRIRLAIIGTGAGNVHAQIRITLCVIIYPTTEHRITTVYSGNGEEHTCEPKAFGMVSTGNRWVTENGTRARECDATIACVTGRMILYPTTQRNATFITS